MDPDIACWIRRSIGVLDNQDGQEVSRNVPIRLLDAVRGIVPNQKELCKGHHLADKDATMTWFLCRELASLCGAASATD